MKLLPPRLATNIALCVSATGLGLATLATPAQATPASEGGNEGASAFVSARIDDRADTLGRTGNVHLINVGAEVNPEGWSIQGDITSYDCAAGQAIAACDRVTLHRLEPADPVTVTVHRDGSAHIRGNAHEVGRRGRWLRTVNFAIDTGPGSVSVRQNADIRFNNWDNG
ncbi:MAG: hypothetical protein ACRCYU_19160 [Nocardioides sp.]